jgi:hypothetical protein
MMMVKTMMIMIMMVMQETKFVSYSKISISYISRRFVVYAEYRGSPLVGCSILR